MRDLGTDGVVVSSVSEQILTSAYLNASMNELERLITTENPKILHQKIIAVP